MLKTDFHLGQTFNLFVFFLWIWREFNANKNLASPLFNANVLSHSLKLRSQIIALLVYFCVFEDDFGNLNVTLFCFRAVTWTSTTMLFSAVSITHQREPKPRTVRFWSAFQFSRAFPTAGILFHFAGVWIQVSVLRLAWEQARTVWEIRTQVALWHNHAPSISGQQKSRAILDSYWEVQLLLVISSKRRKPAASLLCSHLQKGAGFSPWYTLFWFIKMRPVSVLQINKDKPWSKK